jgi:hypothetical protein
MNKEEFEKRFGVYLTFDGEHYKVVAKESVMEFGKWGLKND